MFRLEDFERMTDAELRAEAVKCFDQAGTVEKLVGTIYLPMARFYLDELERRARARSEAERDAIEAERWKTDLRYERAIVFLIIGEILLAIGLAIIAGKQQGREFDRQLAAT